MNLNDFEKQIEPRILERGRRYFDDGRVLSIEKKDLLVYEALVGGTECYTVSISLDGDGNIQETECDCPYMLGEYCKHQVAAFLALQKMLEEPADLQATQSVPSGAAISSVPHILLVPSVPRQNWQARLNQTLKQKTKDELIQYMIDLASDDETIRHQIELRFGDQDEPAAIKQAIQVIRAHIANATDRHGFVGYSDTFTATRGAAMVLEKARQACSRGRMQHALDLALSTLREMVALVNKCDDSNGNVGDIIAECIGTIGEIVAIAELAATPEEKTQLFSKLLAEAAHRRYEGWDDWQLDLLKCCAMLASTPKLRAKLDKRLAAMTDMTAMTAADATESWSRQYKAEEIALIQYEMVKRLDGKAAAQAFIANHLDFSAFRKMAIEAAMQAKDYEAAIQLALDGEAVDSQYRGLVRDWQKARYAAYKCAGQLDRQRELAMMFILDDEFEYYLELKKTYDPKEWATIYPGIIQRFEKEKSWLPTTYTRILIEENEKERLLQYVQRNPSRIEAFAQYLLPDFREAVFDVFARHIKHAAAEASNRKAYQAVCGIIRNLKKIGGSEQAKAIKEELLQTYQQRPALWDELSKV